MRLLDLLNAPEKLLVPDANDRTTLATILSVCRARLDALNWEWRRTRVRVRPSWTDNAGSTTPADSYLLKVVGEAPEDVPGEEGSICSNDEIAFMIADRTRTASARKIVEWLSETLNLRRRRVGVPPWPVAPGAFVASERITSTLGRWRSEWERLRTARLWRCEDPGCSVVGGRYFLLKTPNGKDCKYCRRQRSKATRARRRHRANRNQTAWVTPR